ncbi:hypothetical protein A6A19_05190 [Actinobacillus delphinicola]|uniref:Beta-phosphoglucomutase family hydrolase n=2 Tax=Actinobacillus delphinicola TaxID=51161 RepID=A0A448TUA8_9PAST|nr:hypothetical protein [Actinobacillus delphinicola]VEJ09443.1 beta-phosphoglucomutase family hydrolase [Actinobacillus delphinicola]
MNKNEKIVMEVDAVLFDMDGTLIDSSAACARIWGRWADHYGLDKESVIHQSHGRRPEDTARSVLGNEADIAKAVELFTVEEAKETDVKTIPGARELLHSLPEDKWAIVTSSTENIARERLRYCHLPLPNALITAEKVKNGKPDPEGYLMAAKSLNADIKNCVVIEDAPGGLEAGHNAGAKVIALATTYSADKFPKEIVVKDLTAIHSSINNGKIILSFMPIDK